MAIAERFANDARVSDVLYPGLPSHPGHGLAVRFGGPLRQDPQPVVRVGLPTVQKLAVG